MQQKQIILICMKVKTFSAEEANRLIPKIKESLDDISALRRKMNFMKAEMEWIHEFWGKDLQDSDNADYDKYKQLDIELETLHSRMLGKIEKIEDMGCVVKDINSGLIDFYSIVNGDLAFLCWKYGEREIKHWHGIEAGFAGRTPLTPVDTVESK